MKNITISIIQFNREKKDPDYNLSSMLEQLQGVKEDSDIILMPEGWLGTDVLEMRSYLSILEKLVAGLPGGNCLLAAGAHYVKTGDLIISRGAFILPPGPEVVYFEKQFPSNAIEERKFVARGSSLPVIEYQGLRIGGVVCVDLFYPEVVRGLALRGADLVLNPANIPGSRMSLWQKLGAARAGENTIFVAMANNTGTGYPDGREVSGESFIAFPGGDTIYTCGAQPGVYRFTVDLSEIGRVRKRWRYLEDIIEERERVERWYSR